MGGAIVPRRLDVMNPIDYTQIDHHIQHYQKILEKGDLDGYLNPDSYWHWEHVFCMNHISDFFGGIPNSTFLTLGDGYCGREGTFIKRFGHFVHATDIQPCLIEVAHQRGLVDAYSKEDLNKLSFSDQSFDFVFTKESLHHLSRPYIGLYEMLRVARKGVIIIEPNGDHEKMYHYNKFEATGNYMWGFSSHELIKAGIAFGYKFFAVTYSIVFFCFHDMENIKKGNIQEEKNRLIALDRSYSHMSHKPLVIIFFFREKEFQGLFSENQKYITVEEPSHD